MEHSYYKQLQGTAMGTKLAPAYANVFVTGPAKINHMSANYTKLYFCQYLQL